MNKENTSLNNLLNELKESQIRIFISNNKIRYDTSNLEVLEDHIKFQDKKGNNVILAISEISQIIQLNEVDTNDS